jgi:hypothetical protein
MTLLDAPPFDAKRDRRRRILIIVAAVAVVVGAAVYLYWPHYEATRTVDRFFGALMDKNYQEAYAIWQADPKYYTMDVFMKDWGPQSQWGTIKSFRIVQLGLPPGGHASGLVALVQINGIQSEEARIWIENGSEVMSFYQG